MILIKQFLICWMHFTFFIKCAHCGGVGFWTSYKKGAVLQISRFDYDFNSYLLQQNWINCAWTLSKKSVYIKNRDRICLNLINKRLKTMTFIDNTSLPLDFEWDRNRWSNSDGLESESLMIRLWTPKRISLPIFLFLT